MAKLLTSLLTLATLAASGLIFAHPHPENFSLAELIKRQEFQKYSRRSLGDCASKLKARGGVAERAISRRFEFARKVRETRGLNAGRPFKRDLATILATDHHSNRTDITTDSDADTVFDGNTTCVLAATGEVGPFFVKGEYVRSDLTEDQEGVDLYVDLQFIDVSTCEPLSGVYVDTWSANATGVYSGVISTGNGVGDSDPSNINTTFLRGIQQTSDEGFIQFHTLFPGHYTGRTHHVHLVVHQTDGTLNENGTYSGGSYTHHGQVFFDQSLITEVNELSPYDTNNGTLTTNDEDRVLSDEQDVDPVLEYVLLGDSLSDGILGWISLGINTTANAEVDAASVLTADGGVANDTAGDLPSGSAFPSGGIPSNSALFPSASA